MTYSSPLATRYASPDMINLWSDVNKFRQWRLLWLFLAEEQAKLGLNITADQTQEMRENLVKINIEEAEALEQMIRHDVMSHLHAFGIQCPLAKPIIHLGATSCYITDNADLMLMKDAMYLLRGKLKRVILALCAFANYHRQTPTLSYTHLQAAQPTTVGRRACLWAADFLFDFQELDGRYRGLKARGVKGTTGTQASFLELFDGDHGKVKKLDESVARRMDLNSSYGITGQTYSRKIDSQILDMLSGIASSAHKIATDLRLLAHLKEVEEPFGKSQVGSSAMAYKRNPMKCEQVCGIARFVHSLQSNGFDNHATQWMERTLDDSANRRLVIPQAFLAVDAILESLFYIIDGLVVYPEVMRKNLNEEIPFMVTETILMRAVTAGGDRQVLHEKLRVHCHAAAAEVKHGRTNDLLDRLNDDPIFCDFVKDIKVLDLVGRSVEQVDEFCSEVYKNAFVGI